jgi:hypothetical protein
MPGLARCPRSGRCQRLRLSARRSQDQHGRVVVQAGIAEALRLGVLFGRSVWYYTQTNTMNPRKLWSRILVIVGSVALLAGVVDPMEGSLVILAGSALLLVGTLIGKFPRHYEVWAFILTAVGVGALWLLSAFGGFSGKSGHSMWWGLVILPYPAGWILGIWSAILRLFKFFRLRNQAAESSAD